MYKKSIQLSDFEQSKLASNEKKSVLGGLITGPPLKEPKKQPLSSQNNGDGRPIDPLAGQPFTQD